MTIHNVDCHDPDYYYIDSDGYQIDYAGYEQSWGASGEFGGLQLGCNGSTSFYNAYLLVGNGLSYTYEGEITVGGVVLLYQFGGNLQRTGRSFFLDHAVCPLTAEIPIVGTLRMPDGFYDKDGIVLPYSVYVQYGAGYTNKSFVSFPDARLMMAPSSCAAPVFYNHNTWWKNVMDTYHEGTASSKMTSDAGTGELLGYLGYRPSVKVGSAGVVHITADNVHYDYFFRCYRNATQVFEYGRYDTPDQGGDTGSISHTFSVSEGDVITLGDPDDYNVLTNFKMWWTQS